MPSAMLTIALDTYIRQMAGNRLKQSGEFRARGFGSVTTHSIGTPGRHGERPGDVTHLRSIQRPDKRDESSAFHSLDVIQIDRGLMLQALFDADRHLARCAAARRRDRSHHDGVKKRNHFLP